MNKRQLAAMAAAAMMLICMPTTAFAALGRPGQPSASVQQQVKSERKVIKKNVKETEEKWQQQMLESVNKERKAAGLAELELDAALCKAAQVRAQECLEQYSHTRPDGRASRTAMDDQGVSYSWWGENINEEQDTVASTMKSWMASKGQTSWEKTLSRSDLAAPRTRTAATTGCSCLQSASDIVRNEPVRRPQKQRGKRRLCPKSESLTKRKQKNAVDL